jgi:TRAP-type mannitol/chloroaromatic compound transport system permease small subunit
VAAGSASTYHYGRNAEGGPSLKSLLALAHLIDKLNRNLARVATWLVFLSCLISAGNAASRYAFSISSNAWLEIQWYMFGAMFMLGASYTLKVNEHVRVDVVYGHLETRTQLWIDILGSVLFLLPTTVIIGWLSWPMFISSYELNEVSLNAGGLLRWPVKIFVPLGFALLTLQGLSEIIKRVGALTGHCLPPPHYEKPLQ